MGGLAAGGWVAPPRELSLGNGEVHLWWVDLGRELPPSAEEALSPDEVARAARFRFERDRHQFLLSGYALRDVLSRYLGEPARAIELWVSAKGKPSLKGRHGQELHFSLSHAALTAVVAVSRARVGVDVERLVEDYPHMDVADGFFARGEAERLRAEKDAPARAALFFSYWTRKEALLKASGEGLYGGLDGIDLSAAGSEVTYRGKKYSVAELEPEGRSLCSLAVEGPLGRVERYRWEP